MEEPPIVGDITFIKQNIQNIFRIYGTYTQVSIVRYVCHDEKLTLELLFEVGLPWKDDVVVMPPSYDMALRRLRTNESEDKWPMEREESVAAEDEVVVSYANEKGSFDHLPDIGRFSSYERFIRTTARVLAFIDMCRRRANRVELRHVQEAERLWLLKSQHDDFNEEIACLAPKKPLSKSQKTNFLRETIPKSMMK